MASPVAQDKGSLQLKLAQCEWPRVTSSTNGRAGGLHLRPAMPSLDGMTVMVVSGHEIGGYFGKEFVASQSDRDHDAQRLLDVGGKPRQHLGRPHAVQPFGTAELMAALSIQRGWESPRP